MQKQKGFTLLELVVVIALIGAAAGSATPSLQSWQRNQSFDTDTRRVMEVFSDARANALSEKNCAGNAVLEWTVFVDDEGTKLLCLYDNAGIETEVEVSALEWKSDVQPELEVSATFSGWTPLINTGLRVSIFPGGTQARIGTKAAMYRDQWARVLLISPVLRKENTICYSRIANYPFLSPAGTCVDS